MAKRGPYRKYTKAFKQMAVDRMMGSENIETVGRALGVPPRLLYYWRDQLVVSADPNSPSEREKRLRNENSKLKRALADKTLQIDFFRGALQKIEARRQRNDESGAKASTTKSEK